jgi:hypothetical protein
MYDPTPAQVPALELLTAHAARRRALLKQVAAVETTMRMQVGLLRQLHTPITHIASTAGLSRPTVRNWIGASTGK